MFPRIESAGALADWLLLDHGELAWFADLKGLGYPRNRPRLRHYRYQVRTKRSGSIRLIEAPKMRLKKLQRQLLPGREVDAPVLLPAGFVLLGALRPFLAVADGLQPVGGNAEPLEELFGGAGAAVAQPEVVLGGAAFVAMTLDDDGRIGEIAQDTLQRGAIPGENVAGVTADIGLIVVEVSVQDFRRDALRKADLSRLLHWRRGRRRRRHVDRGGSRVGSARTRGGQCIGGGVARVDATAASALYGAKKRIRNLDSHGQDRNHCCFALRRVA